VEQEQAWSQSNLPPFWQSVLDSSNGSQIQCHVDIFQDIGGELVVSSLSERHQWRLGLARDSLLMTEGILSLSTLGYGLPYLSQLCRWKQMSFRTYCEHWKSLLCSPPSRIGFSWNGLARDGGASQRFESLVQDVWGTKAKFTKPLMEVSAGFWKKKTSWTNCWFCNEFEKAGDPEWTWSAARANKIVERTGEKILVVMQRHQPPLNLAVSRIKSYCWAGHGDPESNLISLNDINGIIIFAKRKELTAKESIPLAQEAIHGA